MEQSPNVEMRNMYAFLHAFSHALPYVANIGKHMAAWKTWTVTSVLWSAICEA